jgi:HSP20 family molecular chaperone IbpA
LISFFIIKSFYSFGFVENDMIITESDGSRKFQLAFDMRGFEPEEVKIKTQNGTLTISAKKEKKV